MRDEDVDNMSISEFNRKYKDSHTEIKAQSIMKQGFSGGRGNNLKHPSDRGINSNPAVPIPEKHEIEKKCYEKQQQRNKEYFSDAFWVRKAEVLDPEAMPISKLSDLIVKMMPQKVEGNVTHEFSYADMVLTAAKNLNQLEHLEVLETTSEEAIVEQDQ